MIELRIIDESNYKKCLNLSASVENRDFVDPVAYSLAEALVFYNDTKPFAIYKGEVIIGFVSIYIGEGNFQIINFLIDDAFQRKGFGTCAAKICISFIRENYNADRMTVPVQTENMVALNFWKKLGFERSGNIEDGYVFMRLNMV